MNSDVGSLYMHDVAILKKFHSSCYSLTLCKRLRISGFEIEKRKHSKKNSVNNTKLNNNISRAKSKVREYALCNYFQYFVTLTIDKTKYNRYDLKTYYKDLSQFLLNYGKVHKTKIQYILIPERHKDGAWHMHGLITGILDKHLIENKNNYLSWKQYSKKFGYMSLGMVQDHDKVANYITKYITKDMSNTINDLGGHMYYCSKGLKTAEIIKKGTLLTDNMHFDFVNDYVKVKSLTDDSISNYIDSI